MKKLFTILALTTIVFVSNAQKVTKTVTKEVETVATMDSSDYKPTKGTVTTEVGLTGGSGNSGFALNTSTIVGGSPTLKFRYFYKENIALRLGFAVNRSATNSEPTSTIVLTPGPSAPASTTTITNFDSKGFFGINLGVEKHFKGSDRLSTYVGADLLFGTKSSFNEKVTTTPTTSTTVTDKNNTGETYFGLGLLTGADYYIAKKVYLGVELGISLIRKSDKDRVQTNSNTVSGTTTSSETTTATGGSNFELTTSLMGGVRIGYQF